jgi:hypothetical protein
LTPRRLSDIIIVQNQAKIAAKLTFTLIPVVFTYMEIKEAVAALKEVIFPEIQDLKKEAQICR